jgi:hypothetical protein
MFTSAVVMAPLALMSSRKSEAVTGWRATKQEFLADGPWDEFGRRSARPTTSLPFNAGDRVVVVEQVHNLALQNAIKAFQQSLAASKLF